MHQQASLGEYLRQLRTDAGLTLRQVEARTNGVVSNVYLSQIETGKRTGPNPRFLVALAKVYDVPARVLFEFAGYVEAEPTSAVEVAFEQVKADPGFQFGTRFKGDLDEESKRVIVELYEKATGKRLLGTMESDAERAG